MLYMFRNFCRFRGRVPYHLAFILFPRPNYDHPQISNNDDEEVISGTKGLKRLYTITKDGVDLGIIKAINNVTIAAFCGFMYGAFTHSQTAFFEFMKKNKAASFANVNEARKTMESTVRHSLLHGGLHWAGKISVLTAVYMFVLMNGTAYHGYNCVLDYLLAGAVTGAVWKFHLGLKGMFSGAVIIMGLSLVYGVMTDPVKFISTTWHDMQRFYTNVKIQRSTYVEEGLQKETADTEVSQNPIKVAFKESTNENVAKAKDEAKT